MTRNLLGITGIELDSIMEMIDAAGNLDEKLSSGARRLGGLEGHMIATAFFEPSTRTRLSFEVAARWLGAEVLTFNPATSSTVKGESLEDTARTLAAIGADLFVVRHAADDAPARFAAATGRPVISGGAGTTSHPTQTLADLLTIQRHFGHVEGLHVGIVGDIANSRVAAGLIATLPALGAWLELIGPSSLLPPKEATSSALRSSDLDASLPGLDIVYLLRVQVERGSETGYESEVGYATDFGMDARRFQTLRSHAVVMHPGPMIRGVEITDEVADHPRCLAREQVAMGVPARMAGIQWCLGGGSG